MNGFAVFVYLYLSDSGECAVYVPANGTVAAERYQAEEGAALTFVESMGFIMDNLNFRGRPAEEQEELIRTLPVFQREPPAPSDDIPGLPASISGVTRSPTGKGQGVVTLGKLFSAFSLLLALGCAHVSEQDVDKAQIHYELALQSLVKNPQLAMRETEEALRLNPELAEAWHAKAPLPPLVRQARRGPEVLREGPRAQADFPRGARQPGQPLHGREALRRCHRPVRDRAERRPLRRPLHRPREHGLGLLQEG
jgi:hypothetical protein